MKKFLIGIILALASTGAFATQNGGNNGDGCHGNCPQSGGGTTTSTATAAAAANAKATAVGVGVGVGVGLGGEGGAGGTATTGPVTATATGAPVNVTSKSLSIGGTGLSASANACQGSFSVGPVGKTYDIDFCRTLAIRDGMAGAGFSQSSQQRVMCAGIADLKDLPECQQQKAAQIVEPGRIVTSETRPSYSWSTTQQ